MTAQPSSQAEREDVAREVLRLRPETFARIAEVARLGPERLGWVRSANVWLNKADAEAIVAAFSDREHATPRYTYDVTWSRPDGERLTCRDLTPKLVTARIIQAVKTSGLITIHAIEGHAATPRSMPEEVVEASDLIDRRALAAKLDQLIAAAALHWGAGSQQHNLIRDVADAVAATPSATGASA